VVTGHARRRTAREIPKGCPLADPERAGDFWDRQASLAQCLGAWGLGFCRPLPATAIDPPLPGNQGEIFSAKHYTLLHNDL